MSAIIYYTSLPFIYLLSLLPFPLLYLLSDGLYLLLYHVTGYRKKVINKNLRNSFPEKTPAEIIILQKKFYRYFCDLLLETFKTLTISRDTMLRRCSLDPAADKIFSDFAAENKSLIIVMGHKGNWEWAGNTFGICCKHQLYVIYHPLANKYFDKLVRKIRSKYNAELVETRKAIPLMAENQEKGILSMYGLASDQSPKLNRAFHWEKFMGIEVPVHTGAEMLAKRYNLSVLFVKVKKVKRGFYEATFIPMADNPISIPDFEITNAFLS